MPALSSFRADPNLQIVTGACPHDCPDTCSWQVAVDPQTGRAQDIWGHPDHPITQGALCAKVDRYLERTYDPERLTTPLRRTGPKGSGQFEPVTWDVALADIAARVGQVIDRWGPESVLPYTYAGTMGLVQRGAMAQRFFHRMQASRLAETICSIAGGEGYTYTIGSGLGMMTEDYAHARLILIWGSNTLTSNVHLWQFIQQAQKRGARVIVIDPAQTRTARLADAWLPIRPGTDAALALALMHVIIDEELFDADYVARYTEGFAPLAARVAEWTPERAAEITGIDADAIRTLARDYATTAPAAIRVNYGLQRHAGGGMAVRAITCLPALVGAWRVQGGGIQLSTSAVYREMNSGPLNRPDLLAGAKPRTINMSRLGDALALDPVRYVQALHHPRPVDVLPAPADAGPPVHALFVFNANPAAVCPDQRAVLEGLRREDLFTVVLEHFQTDTADYADYVLPATTQLEHWDLHKAYGHEYVSLNRPAIAPIGESLPNSEIFRRLAAAMGYAEPCFAQGDEATIQEILAVQTAPIFAGVTWEALLAEGFVRVNLPRPFLPFAQGGFPTPSGKCEFFSARMAQDGYDPLPTFTPPAWLETGGVESAREKAGISEQPVMAEKPGALVCISPPAHSFLNSSFANLARFRGREKTPAVILHPRDAAARAIHSGDRVRIHNQYGAVVVQAQVPAGDKIGIAAGTVLAPGVWWSKFSPGGVNINQVTPQGETDMGGGAVFYDVQVWVERVAAEEVAEETAEETAEIAARLTTAASAPVESVADVAQVGD